MVDCGWMHYGYIYGGSMVDVRMYGGWTVDGGYIIVDGDVGRWIVDG